MNQIITIADVGIKQRLNDLGASAVRDLLDYSPETGVITRRRRSGKALAGAVAGTKNSNGHLQISINSRLYLAHRLAWVWMTGAWPEGSIDHINGIRDDNRWGNLRDVDDFLNAQNQRTAHSNSASGLLGVHFDPRIKKFRAQINISGKRVALGVHETSEAAFATYLEAKKRHHAGFVCVQRKPMLKQYAMDWRMARTSPQRLEA